MNDITVGGQETIQFKEEDRLSNAIEWAIAHNFKLVRVNPHDVRGFFGTGRLQLEQLAYKYRIPIILDKQMPERFVFASDCQFYDKEMINEAVEYVVKTASPAVDTVRSLMMKENIITEWFS